MRDTGSRLELPLIPVNDVRVYKHVAQLSNIVSISDHVSLQYLG